MAMDGIEYSKGLSKAREDYHNKIREYKDNTDQDVKKLNKLHENTVNKQRENFLNAREKLNQDYETQLDSLGKKSAENLKDKQEYFTRKLNEEQQNFNRDRKDIKDGFDRRLNEVNNSFNTNVKNMEIRHELDNANTKLQTRQTIENQQNRHQKEIEDISERTQHSQNKAVEDVKEAKRQLLQRQSNEINDLNNKFAEKSFKKDLQHEEIMQNMKDSALNEFNTYKKNKENVEEVLKKSNEKSLADMSRNFEDAAVRNRRGQMDEVDKLVDDFTKKELENKRQFANEKADLNRTLRSIREQSAGGDGTANTLRDTLKSDYDRRDAGRKKQMNQLQSTFERESKTAQDKFLNTLDDKKVDFKKKLENKDKDFSDYVASSNFKHNMDKDKIIENYDERGKIQDEEHRRASASERSSFKRTQNAQLKNFAETVNRLNSDNAQLLDQTRDIFNKEKTELIEGTKKDHANLINELTKEKEEKLTDQASYFKDRVDYLNNYQKLTENQMEDRLHKMQESRAFDLSFQDQKHSDIRNEDWNTMKENLRLKNIENDLKVKEIQRENRNLIQKMARGFQNKMNEAVSNYEGQIRQLHADYNKKLASKTMELRNSQKLMKAQFDQQKTIAEGQHQDDINKIRNSYEEEINKLRNANRSRDMA